MLTQKAKTACAPAKIVLEDDRRLISANGTDLSFVIGKLLMMQALSCRMQTT